MKTRLEVTRLFLVAAAGIAAGGAVADQAVRTWAFEKTTLFKAIQRVHTDTKAGVIFAVKGTDAMSFRVKAGDPRKAVSGVAGQYGKEAIYVGRIFVLKDALPEGGSFRERSTALNAYVMENLPTEVNGGQRCAWLPASEAHRASNMALHGQMGRGTWSFGNLLPNQQQAVLDMVRYRTTVTYVHTLENMINDRFPTTVNTPPVPR